MSVVEKFVLKAMLVLVNVGYLVEAASGHSHKYNYRVDISKTRSLGKVSRCALASNTDVRNSHQFTQLEGVYCAVVVHRPLPNCKHSASMACSADPSQIRCTEACDVERLCCSRRCPAQCWECRKPPTPPLTTLGLLFQSTRPRVDHVRHACGKVLCCQHTCEQFCATGHVCGDCTSECRQSCVHHSCELGCSIACTPCAEPCPWSCPHQTCPVPCGSVSSSTTISVP